MVESQVLHIEATSRRDFGRRKLVLIGSSSVVNGVDCEILARSLGEHAINLEPVNYGMTGMLAGELPFFNRVAFGKDVAAVVYLYNVFSFADVLHPEAPAIRWNTVEALRLMTIEELRRTGWVALRGAIQEHSFILRFRDLIQDTVKRALSRELRPPAYPFDYPPDEALTSSPRPSEPEQPLPDTDWFRMIYIESQSEKETLGDRGLARFLRVANQRNVPVIVAPIPEPTFVDLTRYGRGTDRARVDVRARRAAETGGGQFLGREAIGEFEADDLNFRDHVHMRASGRQAYSALLASQIAALLPKN
jgi:hypothetical protein